MLLGILADRSGAIQDLEAEVSTWEEVGLHSWCLDRLARRWRPKVLERLAAGLGGQRQLFMSLYQIWQAEGYAPEPDRDDPEAEEVDVTQIRWCLVDIVTPGQWCYEDEDRAIMTRGQAEGMEMPLRLASWVKAGCPWLGRGWE